MKKLSIIILLIFAVSKSFAQMPDFSKEAAEAMTKLSVMNGKWEGKGWSMMPNGEKHSSNVFENMQWKLDNTVLQIEGVGKTDEGQVVHNALGIIYYDPMQKKYKMHSHLSSGLSTQASFEVIEPNRKFEWLFEDGRGGTVKYVITIDAANWKEEGEYSRPGMPASKFFEMNLKKVN